MCLNSAILRAKYKPLKPLPVVKIIILRRVKFDHFKLNSTLFFFKFDHLALVFDQAFAKLELRNICRKYNIETRIFIIKIVYITEVGHILVNRTF